MSFETVERVTLESLLSGSYYGGASTYRGEEPIDIILEQMDIISNLSIIEQSLTAYEAAKTIKAKQAPLKKAKLKKKKMKAKDAKKISKSKVFKITKEDDEFPDGGTGPLPTTSDTNGMTDTDLDADPNGDVVVSEIIDDNISDHEATGTEGVDWVCYYDDPEMLAFEDEEKNLFQKLGEGIKKLWETIKNFVISVIEKISGALGNNVAYLKQNGDKIDRGFKVAKEQKLTIKTDVVMMNSGLINAMVQDVAKGINEISSTALKDFVTGPGITRSEDTPMEKFKSIEICKTHPFAGTGEDNTPARIISVAIFANNSPYLTEKSEPIEINILDSGFTSSRALSDVIDSKIVGAWKTINAAVNSSSNTMIKAINAGFKASGKAAIAQADKVYGSAAKDDKEAGETHKKSKAAGIQKAGITVQKLVSSCFSIYTKANQLAAKVMRKAGSAGGAKGDDAAEKKESE
jgi:hypothetical protein